MRKLLFILILFVSLNVQAQSISTTKPWTYWWWMGSTVTKPDIKAQLLLFKNSGVGGVHIIPIYGVKGKEQQAIPFLSAEWIDVMQFTVNEGKKLGIGVDLTTGTGWPFGGPNVSAEMAAKNMSVVDGRIDVKPTGQKVKRAAPGGEGYVLDPFHADAMPQYLTRFDSAFSGVKGLPRSMYMDSYEAYGANWTNDFADQFAKRRKYALVQHLPALSDSTSNVDSTLIRIDYHQTLAELLLERYALPWTKWSREHRFMTRYQAHGSPANLLDLYAAADIPETESFGTSRFDIPGVRIDPDYSIDQFGTPNALAMKFASSAANFNGKKLVSSETGTWLANHFKVSLSQLKPQIDELFAAGINHIFYHGTTYSPQNEAYPGWLFYASTNFGPTSHFAREFPLLNRYVEKCQSILQDTKPDNDLLVYFPIHDLWATKSKSSGNVHLLEVHHVDRWLLGLPFGKLSEKLWKEGYSFDFVSDLQLAQLKISASGTLTSRNASYKAIVIPASTYMPKSTLSKLHRLAEAGAKIIFEKQMPSIVTGFDDHATQQAEFEKMSVRLARIENVKIGTELNRFLSEFNIAPEEMAHKGLTYIRKKDQNGQPVYFVTNLGNTFQEGWIKLNAKGRFFKLDPLNGRAVLAQRGSGEKAEVFLKLKPGQSCFLEVGSQSASQIELEKPTQIFEIKGNWNLTFIEGKPSLPASAKLSRLSSWTTLPDSAEYFSGKAKYQVTFDLPAEILKGKSFELDLGDVRESAFVKINGKELGTFWSVPFLGKIPSNVLKSKGNVLDIEVTNLSANYMRLRDTQQPDWKKFQDINIVDITYKKFDAKSWEPMPSGQLGPVRLLYR
ncbi:glycosyl hydrolase [Dyadobacter sp. Leaf189]|uniref:glycosyl hydrolase n=1 Tax=Dyadobacter sp. Leaf189 TaxID=1736295 RepID=UPI0006F7357D|nr:glycosyl hydrolase [Dyadobacter sp. Leaf189]KQS25550.1 glycoside hydrolase [Dyadobacter sp. Leaf189]